MEESVFWQIVEEKGEVKGERNAVLRVGARRFGAVPPAVQERLAQISSLPTLQAMLDRVLDVASWDELLQTA